MSDAGYLANTYRREAMFYRQEAHSYFRSGHRAAGRVSMKQAVRCWKRFRLWMARNQEPRQ